METTLVWKGFTYEAKPFTLDNLYAVYEITSQSLDDGRLQMRNLFKLSCPILLDSPDKEAKQFLASGKLSESVLNEVVDVQGAFKFKESVDFLYSSTYEQGEKLKNSAPDLAPAIEDAKARSNRRSQKDTKEEPAVSG